MNDLLYSDRPVVTLYVSCHNASERLYLTTLQALYKVKRANKGDKCQNSEEYVYRKRLECPVAVRHDR